MPAYRYARVSINGDGSKVWGGVQIFPDELDDFAKDNVHGDFAQSVADLGEEGFELVTIVNDIENADGVWRETWVFRLDITDIEPVEKEGGT